MYFNHYVVASLVVYISGKAVYFKTLYLCVLWIHLRAYLIHSSNPVSGNTTHDSNPRHNRYTLQVRARPYLNLPLAFHSLLFYENGIFRNGKCLPKSRVELSSIFITIDLHLHCFT